MNTFNLLSRMLSIFLFKSPLGFISACISGLCFIFREQNMKSLVYLINVLGLAPFLLNRSRIFRKFRPSTPGSNYSGVMLLMFLFSELAVIFGNIFRDETDKKP